MKHQDYAPPFALTNKIVNLVGEISAQVAVLDVKSKNYDNFRLRRENRIKSIQSSLAIENNSLSLEQVTAIINGKRVLAPLKDVKEAENAIKAYALLDRLDPYSIDDLRKAHQTMTLALVEESGVFRSGDVGVFQSAEEKGSPSLIHRAPPARLVAGHIENLFRWLQETELHPLISSSVFHYEFEYIHPFVDGNGRMGRLWQTLLLSKWQSVFAWIPLETVIKDNQSAYYQSIGESTIKNDSAFFVDFMLNAIKTALQETSSDYDSDYDNDYVVRLMQVLGDKELSSSQLMQALGLSHASNFRKNYLAPALERGLIEQTIPDKPKSKNQKYRRKRK